MVTSPSSPQKTRESSTTTIPYPSPPHSPRRTKSPNPEVPKASEDKARPAGTISSAPPPTPPRAPCQHSSTAVANDGPQDNKSNVPDLKTRLGLNGGLCGGTTRLGQPCRKSSPAKNKGRIQPVFESLAGLTQSSPGLDSELYKLAELVHCNYHASDDSKKSRVNTWITKFPVGENGPNPIASVQRQVKAMLNLVSTKCSMGGEPPCPQTIGGQKVQNCAKTIAEIVRPEVFENDAHLDYCLGVLETNMLCYFHDKQPLTKVESWKSEIRDIWEKQLAKPVRDDEPERMRSRTEARDDSAQHSGGSPILNFPRDLRKFWPAEYATSLFEIIPNRNPPRGIKSSHKKVQKMILQPLAGQSSQSSGFVYAYQAQGNPGYVKIGYTANSVKKRLDEWGFDCNRIPELLYPISPDTSASIPNVRRVEALCHAELGHRNIRIDCKGCLKIHKEWFEVSAAEAIAVIKKWSKWMATCPYEPIDLRDVDKWKITERERKKTMDMDRFMRDISEPEGRS